MRNANYDGCVRNDIRLPAETKYLPPLHIIYDGAMGTGRSDKLYYFNANHLGSGSLITDGNGKTYQTLAHSPFGVDLVNIRHYQENYDEVRHFGGHRIDETTGLLDMGARDLDPILSIEYTTDPMWYKFPSLSPYNAMGNNPIMFVDPDGRDLVVLNAPGGASGAGHLGILIGNDKDGWTYMSKDGGNKFFGLFGESKFDDNNGKTFDKIVDFELSEIVRRKDGVNGNGEPYNKGIRFETSTEQDNTAKAAMEKAGKEDYNILTNNCADAVTKALESVGIDPGYDENGKTPLIPNEQFEKISENNKAKVIPIAPKISVATNSNNNSSEINQ